MPDDHDGSGGQSASGSVRRISCALRGRGGKSGQRDSWHIRLEVGSEFVSNAIDTVQKDYLLMEIYEAQADR